ncbi:MAG: MATE family efflux transporter, partial [Erysipelotrichaceae bacterium]|nr:MATE family efflux transporter [Erysipelotrichaceae bacterium]
MSARSDKMANWPVAKLLFSMGVPAVFSMLIQAMYNIVDSIYISRYSADAMFAIGLVFPLQMVGFSIAMGTAVGVSTLVSRRLGERRNDEANAVASTGVILALLHMLINIFLGIFISRPFLSIFTQRAEVIELGYQYLFIVLVISCGQFFAL